MANFISALQALQDNNALNRINYIDISENEKEFLLDTNWECTMTKKPAAVYYPGDDIWKSRLNSVTPGIPADVTGVSQVIRGFTINQKTAVNTAGSISLVFIDREDQAMSAMFDDWKQKICDREIRFQFRKEDTTANLKHVMFNTSRIPVRKLEFLGCQPSSAELKEDGVGDIESNSLGELSVSLDYEHSRRVFLNV